MINNMTAAFAATASAVSGYDIRLDVLEVDDDPYEIIEEQSVARDCRARMAAKSAKAKRKDRMVLARVKS